MEQGTKKTAEGKDAYLTTSSKRANQSRAEAGLFSSTKFLFSGDQDSQENTAKKIQPRKYTGTHSLKRKIQHQF